MPDPSPLPTFVAGSSEWFVSMEDEVTAFTLTPERKAENDAALAAYRAACLSGDIAAIWNTHAVVEGRQNSMGRMGLGAEYERIRLAMSEITRERREARMAARHYAIAAE